MKNQALFALLLVIACFAGAGCVAQSHADKQNDTINTLRDQIVNLKALVESKEAEIAHLSGQIGSDDELRSRLEQAIADLAAQNPGLMTYDAKRGMIRFSSDLTFDLGKTDVKPPAVDSLNQLAAIINSQTAQPYNVRIEGHTDDVPVTNQANRQKYEDNWGLSAFRAKSVMHVLEQAGVASQRMIISGRGEHVPLVVNVPKTGARANRRVEIYLVPRSNFDATPAGNTAPAVVEQPIPEDEGPEVFK
jgi:chemotaxis protein MotB